MNARNSSPGFQLFATRVAEWFGTYWAFLASLVAIAAWALSGPLFSFSDTWQLWINTGTTIVTFLMVFIIQYTQNRDSRSMHLKLDELLRALEGARTETVFAIYAVALKDQPNHLRFFEIYTDEQAYLLHRETPHFKKYLRTTQSMITARKLIEAVPAAPAAQSH